MCEKLLSVRELVENIPDNSKIWMDSGLSQPKGIIDEIGRSTKKLEVHHMFDVYDLPWMNGYYRENVHGVSWFSGVSARAGVQQGIADVMPCYYRDLPMLLRQYGIDCVCLAASPVDHDGYFSLSVTGSALESVIEHAKYIYIEINPQLPYIPGSYKVHISRVTAYCEGDYPLAEAGECQTDDISRKIGEFIADNIPDGATIQLGIGAIPDAVGNLLKSKKHLGIHTELLTDSMIELLKCGAADNSLKEIHKGVSVAGFAYGHKPMYDYLDGRDDVLFMPIDYVNDPLVIAKMSNFISINSAVEVDLYGQVCAESLGTRHLSGTGGQADFVRGAVLSKGGKSFIAFPSTAAHGTKSRIQPVLTPGSIVTTSKNDVDYIVTEYGIAHLRGKTLRQRAAALIEIAHPDFKDELLYEARKVFFI